MDETAASDSAHGQHYPDDSIDDEDDFGDFDIAITHDRNIKLEGRHMVKSFFQDVREHKSLADHKTRSWLGNLPFYMRQDAIPLFVDEDDSRDDFKDYQLHPAYTFMELGKTATQPHDELFRLLRNDSMLEVPTLVIGIGRLFVNERNGEGGRTSKWTGYEVFVDQKLALWMVFDMRSINPRAANWYPLSCRLSHSILQDYGDKQRFLSSASKERRFDIACFLPSLRDLADAKFKTASEKVQKTNQSGKMRVSQVERSEVDKLLKTEVAPQKVESTATVQKPLPPAVGTADSYGLDKTPDKLYDALLDAVMDGRKNGPKMTELLDKYKDNLGIIRKAITKRVVEHAAKNSNCGELIMTKLLDLFQDEVRKSISHEVVKGAAENGPCGAQIMKKLLDRCEGVVYENLSVPAIRAVAENEECGAQILLLLFDVNNRKAMRRLEDILLEVLNGETSPTKVRQSLRERFTEAELIRIRRN